MRENTNRWKRWRKAQKAEAAAGKIDSWSSWLTPEAHRATLEGLCNDTSLSEEELKHLRILEIGGPVLEAAFNDADIPLKVVLDPLFPFGQTFSQQSRCCQHVRGVGEFLPLSSYSSIDLCYITNVIDHTADPVAVLTEIRRVLNESGVLIISSNIFPSWIKPLFPLFDYFDRPHPHHFTGGGLRTLLEREFIIQEERTARILSPSSLRWDARLSLAHNLKRKIAGVIKVKYIFFRCIVRKGE
jgi:SAM-dependent methyltransferase